MNTQLRAVGRALYCVTIGDRNAWGLTIRPSTTCRGQTKLQTRWWALPGNTSGSPQRDHCEPFMDYGCDVGRPPGNQRFTVPPAAGLLYQSAKSFQEADS